MGRVVNTLIVAVVAVVAYAFFTDRLTRVQSVCFNFSNSVQEASKAGRIQAEFPELFHRFGQDMVRALTEANVKTAGSPLNDAQAKAAHLAQFFAKIRKVGNDSTESDGNIAPVNGWRINRDPFSKGSSTFSDGIIGHADLGSGLGHANVTITRRDDGTPVFTVGIPNGQLDIQTKQNVHEAFAGMIGMRGQYNHYVTTETWLPVDYKLDGFDPASINCSMDNPNSFSFSCYIPKYFILRNSFLIGFPIAGEKTVLSIPLRDATVAAFLAQCQQVAISQDNTEDDGQ
jgi:hypothetical protein